MKTDDLRWGVRSDPSRPECVAATKIPQKVGERVVTVKTFENKKRSELLFRKSQKIFFNRRLPKKWRLDLTPPRPV